MFSDLKIVTTPFYSVVTNGIVFDESFDAPISLLAPYSALDCSRLPVVDGTFASSGSDWRPLPLPPELGLPFSVRITDRALFRSRESENQSQF